MQRIFVNIHLLKYVLDALDPDQSVSVTYRGASHQHPNTYEITTDTHIDRLNLAQAEQDALENFIVKTLV